MIFSMFLHPIKQLIKCLLQSHDEYRELGEGMKLYEKGLRKVLINLQTEETFELVDGNGNLLHITKDDINFSRVNQLENSHHAKELKVCYDFRVECFSKGVSLIIWTLYPDGRYFADEDGFGGENNDETVVYAFIDKKGKIQIPFQDMTKDEILIGRKKAEEGFSLNN